MSNEVKYVKNIYGHVPKSIKVEAVLGKVLASFQGILISVLIYYFGELINNFIDFGVNRSLKDITKINDDNTLNDLVINVLSKKQTIENFTSKYPNIDVNGISNNFNNSSYFSFSSIENEFKTMDMISSEFKKNISHMYIIGFVSFILTFGFIYLLKDSSSRYILKTRSILYEKILRDSYKNNLNISNINELASSYVHKLQTLEKRIGPQSGFRYLSLSCSCFCSIMPFFINWRLSLWILGVIVSVNIAISILGLIMVHYTKKRLKAFDKLYDNDYLLISRIKDIICYSNEKRMFKKIKESINKYYKKYRIIYFFIVALIGALTLPFSNVIYMYTFKKSNQYIGQNLRGGDIFKILLCFISNHLINEILKYVDALKIKSTLGANELLLHIDDNRYQYIRYETEEEESPYSTNDFQSKIEFKDVSFKYSKECKAALKDVSFECKKGKKLGIVGSSGSGKSTIFTLLLKLYESGYNAFIDGGKVICHNYRELRLLFGFVPQEPVLFDMTIAENIAITHPEATQEQIEKAAKLANAHEFITKLPNGYQYHYHLGKKKNDQRLTESQKQRICIARALVKNPKIIMIDQSSTFTHPIDLQVEKAIQNIIDSSSEITVLFVSHCSDTLKKADNIIVMDMGSVVEEGTHDELISKQQHYYHLLNGRIFGGKENTITNSSNLPSLLTVDNLIGDDKSCHSFNSVENLLNKNNENNNNNNNGKEISSEVKISLNSEDNKYNSTSTSTSTSTSSSVINDNKNSLGFDIKVNFKHVISYYRHGLIFTLLGLIGSIVEGCLLPLRSIVIAEIINVYCRHDKYYKDDIAFLNNKLLRIMLYTIVAIFIKRFCFCISGEKIQKVLYKDVTKSILKNGVDFLNVNHLNNEAKSDSSEEDDKIKIEKIIKDRFKMENDIFVDLNFSISSMIEFISAAILTGYIVFNYSKMPKAIIIIPIIIVVWYLLSKAFSDTKKLRSKIIGNNTLTIFNSKCGLKTIYTLGLRGYFIDLYHRKNKKYMRSIILRNIFLSIGGSLGIIIPIIIVSIGFASGFDLINKEKIGFLNFFITFISVVYLSSKLCQTIFFISFYSSCIGNFNKIMKIINHKPKIDSTDSKGIKDVSINGNISFKNINFSYPYHSDIQVLHLENDQFNVAKGETVVIIGDKDSGKGAFFDLLLRLYDVERGGEVSIDGINIKEYNVDWLRKQIAIVDANPDIYKEYSFCNYIRLGNEEEAYMEDIDRVVEKVDFNRNMSNFSIKNYQKVKVAFARALIRHPKILLLNDITSGLEGEDKASIEKVIENNMKDYTTIITSTEVPSIQNIDKFILMKNGRIIASGPYENLNDEYSKMINENSSTKDNNENKD